LSTTVQNEVQNEEKMETNEETAPIVEESVNTEENIQNSNAEQTTEQTTESEQKLENVGEVKSSQDEVETAINEQELKYWSAVNENPQDFTSWTYLLQFVEQEVRRHFI
jgi:pre-mRNA-processing factor 39